MMNRKNQTSGGRSAVFITDTTGRSHVSDSPVHQILMFVIALTT